MNLISLSLKNFRCYKDEITIPIDNLTTFIGKNDVGKSTILEALEIFFNNATVVIEPDDVHIENTGGIVEITCEFNELPEKLTLDAGAETSLAQEYLLTSSKSLKIKKTFDCSNKKPTIEIFVIANHPSKEDCNNLLELKEKELQKIVKDKQLDVSLKGNPSMRHAIWNSMLDSLELKEIEIQVNKAKEDKKRIWEQIEGYLPMYALFQSDRSSRDSDDEVQNPMKAAIATAIAEVQDDIKRIQDKVRTKAEEIAQNTHRELAIIDATLASELTPNFTPPTPAKWTGLFSVGLDTDSGIPLNKRGSGIRRLVLISFFKAEAERRLTKSPTRGIIYAIEEPETSQHYNNQIILIDSLKTLSEEQNCQVLLTTHSPGLAAELPTESIRFIKRDKNRKPIIERGSDVFEEVAESLGVTPDSRVKILLCVEGPTDVLALKCLSRALHEADNALPDLSTDTRIAFVPLGGSTLSHWVNNHYLKALHLPEVHIYDGDKSVYQKSIDEVNKESNGSWGVLTKKHEIENYLHPQAISEAFGVNVEIKDFPTNGKGVPTLFAEALSEKNGSSQKLKDNNAKIKLAEKAFPKMTAEWIRERDPLGEIKGWLQNIAKLL